MTHRAVATTLRDTDTPEIGRVTDGLLALMGKAPHSDAVDPSRAREECAARRCSRSSARWPTSGRSCWSSRTCTGPTRNSSSSFPRLLQRLSGLPVVVLATARAEFADDWSPPSGPPQRGERPPRPARRRRHRRAAGRPHPRHPRARSVRRCAIAPAATRSSSRSSRRWPPTGPSGGPTELPATLHGLVAARLDRLAGIRPCRARGCRGHRHDGTDRAGRGPGRDPRRRCPRRRSLTSPAPVCSTSSDDEYSFRNELTREIAYGTLTKAERARRHGAARQDHRDGRRAHRSHRGGHGPARLPLQPRRVAADRARVRRRACPPGWRAMRRHSSRARRAVPNSARTGSPLRPTCPTRSRSSTQTSRSSSSDSTSSALEHEPSNANTREAREDLAVVDRLARELDDSARARVRADHPRRRPVQGRRPHRRHRHPRPRGRPVAGDSATPTGSPRRCGSRGWPRCSAVTTTRPAPGSKRRSASSVPRTTCAARRGRSRTWRGSRSSAASTTPPRRGSRPRPPRSPRSATGVASPGRSACSPGSASPRAGSTRPTISRSAWSRKPASSGTAGPGR